MQEELCPYDYQKAHVTGLFWWFPEENACGNNVTEGWINRGLFDNHTGKVLPAMKEFSLFVQPSVTLLPQAFSSGNHQNNPVTLA